MLSQDSLGVNMKQRAGLAPRPKIKREQATLEAPGADEGDGYFAILLTKHFQSINQGG